MWASIGGQSGFRSRSKSRRLARKVLRACCEGSALPVAFCLLMLLMFTKSLLRNNFPYSHMLRDHADCDHQSETLIYEDDPSKPVEGYL